MNFYEIPDVLDNEIDDLEESIAKFKDGKLAAEQLKIQRVPFGVYEQRKDGTYMVRIRCNAGAITPTQYKKAAELSMIYGNSSIHVTTRQEIQIHDVDIDNIVPIIRGLREVEISSRGGGGNTVRNVMSSFDSGLFDDDVFDVTPYAYELTSILVADKGSWNLPRKYKITFSSKKNNNANAHVQDLGFIADIKDGKKGFRVYAAGGMGGGPELGILLHEFVPAEDIFIIAEALKRVFSQYGNRKNKHKARLRWLLKDIGEEKLRELYNTEVAKLRAEGNLLTFNEDLFLNISDVSKSAPGSILNNSEDYRIWFNRNVKAQKQDNLYGVSIPLVLGNVDSDKAVALAELLENLGDNTLRFTMNQNFYLRNIPGEYLGNVYELAIELSSLSSKSSIFGNSITCTGADTCRLGICLPKGLNKAVIRRLEKGRIDLDKLADFNINISGCPNGCGQHLVADLGFFGKVGRNGQNSYPAYNVVAGAVSLEGKERLAGIITDINARDLPNFLEEVLFDFQSKEDKYSTFAEYVDGEGEKEIKNLADNYRDVPAFEEDKNYYYDWGADEVFSLVGRGQGECSAGLFDLIDFDLKQSDYLIKENNEKSNVAGEDVYRLLIHVARALLITKGIEAPTEKDIFKSFIKQFIGEGHISDSYKDLVTLGAEKDLNELSKHYSDVKNLLKAVKDLYQSMDNSLKFPEDKTKKEKTVVKVDVEPFLNIRKKDLRGVACPMNFVKTKIELSQIAAGDLLEILLDDGEPIANVPRSAEGEGHKVLSQDRIEDYWKVIIEKAG